MRDILAGVNSIVATFGLYSGDAQERLTFWEIFDEGRYPLQELDLFNRQLKTAVRRGFVRSFGDETYQLTSKGLKRYHRMNRLIEEREDEFGAFGFSL